MADDKKKKEQERIKIQLAILGVMMVLVVIVNREKIFGKKGTKTKGRRGTSVASATRTPGAPPPAPGGAAAGPVVANRPSLSPAQIPRLTPEVVTKLRAKQQGRNIDTNFVDFQQLEDTVDPFSDFEHDAEQRAIRLSQGNRRAPAVPSGSGRTLASANPRGAIPRSLLGYRTYGVLSLDGQRQAIVKQNGRIVPYHLKSGAPLPGAEGGFVVHLGGDNRVWVEDPNAQDGESRFFELGSSTPTAVAQVPRHLLGARGEDDTGDQGSRTQPVAVFLDDIFE